MARRARLWLPPHAPSVLRRSARSRSGARRQAGEKPGLGGPATVFQPMWGGIAALRVCTVLVRTQPFGVHIVFVARVEEHLHAQKRTPGSEEGGDDRASVDRLDARHARGVGA